MGNGDLRSEGAFRGGLRGTGPALAEIVREVGLSRCRAFEKEGASIQCSLWSSPADAGVWSGYGWVSVGNGDLGSGAVVGEL